MRSFFAIVLAAGVPISIGYAVACGPPDSFDNLTGRPRDGGAEAEASVPLVVDDTLEAPRPTAPLSGSWINGARPRFRWDLAKSANGARVVVCPDARCSDPSKKKEWPAAGRELQAPEDLPPGRYFWSLVSTTPSTFGSKTSATWTMIVRGGAGDGVPGGNIADVNGDGISDLIVAADIVGNGGTVVHDAFGLIGSSMEDPLALVTDPLDEVNFPREYYGATSEGLLIQCVDANGDGIGDAVFADLTGPGRAQLFGYKGVVSLLNTDDFMNVPILPGLDVIPGFAAPGDLDGDGRGDVIVSSKRDIFAVFGAPDGLGAYTYVDQLPPTADVDAGEIPPPTTTAIAIGGADIDNDGRADVAVASYFRGEGFYAVRTTPERSFLDAELGVNPDAGAETPATRFAFGDVDGDGTNDIAFLTTTGGGPAICIVTRASIETGNAGCWRPASPPAGFASSIVAADLEGDGKDEFLVGSANGGINVLRLPSPDRVEVEPLTTQFGTSLTVLDPGRPKPAVWAATRADGTAIALYVGKEEKRLITPQELAGAIGFGVSRFRPGIR